MTVEGQCGRMDSLSTEEPKPAGVCVIRVWSEPGSYRLRARITAVPDVASGIEHVTATTERSEVLTAVSAFLDAHARVVMGP